MEGDAGSSQLNPTDADETPLASPETDTQETTEQTSTEQPDNTADDRRPTRIGRGIAVAVCAALLVLAVAGGVLGYVLLNADRHNAEVAAAEAAALQSAKDCVSATHAPDVEAMTAAQSKIIECSTGDFAVQSSLYAGVLVDAYQAANVRVQVSDMRAAVEKHNDDGSFDVLVAVRVKVTNSDTADQEQGYRLRVKMAPDEGTFKIARLDQVAS
jgi:Mce-associated membrane protein